MKGGEAVEQEQKWIRAIQRRNSRAAAEQLIQAYYDEIYRFVYRQTGSREDAMDLTQSIFIAVLRALPGYRAERASFRTWMYRIAANKVIDARRRTRLSPVPLEETELPAAEDFVSQIHNQALLDAIEGYVSGLDAGEQAVFRLRIYGEKTFPEIAAEKGVWSRWVITIFLYPLRRKSGDLFLISWMRECPAGHPLVKSCGRFWRGSASGDCCSARGTVWPCPCSSGFCACCRRSL